MGLVIEIVFLIVVALILLLNIVLFNIGRTLKSIPNKTGLSGCEIARNLSDKYSKKELYVIKKNGKNLDFYDKDRNVIKLTPEVFDGTDMYSSIIAFNVAIDTSKENAPVYRKFNAFVTFVSYIIIILGAFLNSGNIIHLELIIFVLAFILELLIFNKFKYSDNELDEYLKKEDIIKPYEEYQSNIILFELINVANLPYRFITI